VLTRTVKEMFYGMNHVIMHDWFRLSRYNMLDKLSSFVLRQGLN